MLAPGKTPIPGGGPALQQENQLNNLGASDSLLMLPPAQIRSRSRLRPVALGLFFFFLISSVVLEFLIYGGYLTSRWWTVATTAFEAGMVGALADWFAVRALFHKVHLGVPIPLLTKHSNIILNNRQRITDNIAFMVQNRWLSPEAIAQQVSRHASADALITWASTEKNMDLLLEQLRKLISVHSAGLNESEVAEFLERVIRDQLKGIRFAKPVGQWIAGAIERGDHQLLWQAVLGTIEKSLADPAFQSLIARELKSAVDQYAHVSSIKRWGVMIAEFTNALDYPVAANKLIEAANHLIASAKENPNNEIRRKIDQMLHDFAVRLSNEEPTAVHAVETLWSRIAENAQLRQVLSEVLGRFSGTICTQAATVDSPLMRMIRSMLQRQLAAFKSDIAARQRFNAWLFESVTNLIASKRDVIGSTVRQRLDELDDRRWVGEIEDKVGDDLQWIRINGAVVGCLIGVLIALSKLAIAACGNLLK
ncbi:MAG TPA: DUF445 domain-containing protein [Tepidisphaeraceae bacterium]|nr:DUF445 domain-containing protein [Tepidisphaeraceae bacterium]